MLLMVMLFYRAKQRDTSCNMQKQNKGKAMHSKTSNNTIRMSTENRRYFLAAGNMNTCPKPNFFSKVLSQCVLEVAAVLHGSLYSRETRKPAYSLASQRSHALFL